MPTHSTLDIGRRGEDLAADFLSQKGYRIVARNYRAGRGEIDLIGWWGERLLVFFEVKTRRSEAFGGPEEAVTPRKQRVLMRTAGAYMESIGYDWAVRFDVVAILLRDEVLLDIRHHEDAFFSP
jgi:putative endonuclease